MFCQAIKSKVKAGIYESQSDCLEVFKEEDGFTAND